jgi:ABC-2 type transport system ATP-binding protein
MADAIRISGVTKTFGPKVAVHNLDLALPEGRIYGFIGPNGAGKTTTIRMIMSIYFPDRGEISVLGRRSAAESKDRIGYLPEERGLYRKMRVGTFLEYMARLKGVRGPEVRRRVRHWLERVQLSDCISKRCQELSKGMQQKVQFLSAIIHEPDLIILDEPFSGLDPVNARLMRELIHSLEGEGKTIIFSTHVMHHAEQICSHVVMINRGVKVLDGSLHDLHQRYDPKTILVEPADGGDTAILGQIPGVREVRPPTSAGSGSRRGNAVELLLAEGADPAETLRRVVLAMPVLKAEVQRASLEDIFIEIVQGTQGAAVAEETARAVRQEISTVDAAVSAADAVAGSTPGGEEVARA